jgi:ORF6N domain
MFTLTNSEWETLKSQIVTSFNGESNNLSQIVIGSQKHREKQKLPYAFTEHGVTMIASILRSENAI